MGDFYNSSNNMRQSRNPPDYYEQQRRIHNRQQPNVQEGESSHPQGRRQDDESVVYVYDEEETGPYGRNNEAVYVYDEGEFGDTDMRRANETLVTLQEQLQAQAMMEQQQQHVDYGQQQEMDIPAESRGRSKEMRRSRSRSRSRRRSRTWSRSRSRTRSRSRSRSRRRTRSRSRSRSRHRRRKRSYSRSYSRSRSRSRSRSPRRRRRSRSSEERDRQHFRYPRYQVEPHYTIAVKGLPIDCDETVIFALIQQQGFQPKDVRILRKKDTGQSRGFGFIEFPDVTSASAWMEHTQGYLIVDDHHHAELQYSVDKPGWNAPQASGSGQMQKFGDWICAKCTMNNFKKRDQCFKCGLPRSESDSMQERGFSEIGITPCDTLLFRDLPDQCDDKKVMDSLKKVTALEPLCVSMGDSKMFAYVQMRNVNEATQLLTTLTQMTSLRIDGCEVIVSYSKLPLTAILTGQTLTQTAEQINRMQRQFSQHASPSMAGLKQSQTDAANAAAAVAQNALRKAHVMRHVTNEVLANQLEAMQAAQLVAAGLVVPPTQLLVQAQQRLLAAKAAVEASTLKLGTVHTPFGELPRYPNPDTSLYQYEPKSGYYFDPSTGLYYDGNSRYYLNAETQQWLFWDARYQTFLPCQQGQQPTADAAGTAQPPPPPLEGDVHSASAVASAATASTAEAVPPETADAEPTKKELDKTEKAKSAKKIAQEMERWAKEQEKRKSTSGKAAPAPSSTDKPAASPFTIRSATADTAFNILERTKGGILPFNEDSDGEDPPPVTSSSSAQRATTSMKKQSESEDDVVDYSKMACLLCRRQFPSRDVLDKHVQLSNLHKQNLEARRGVPSYSREESSKHQHQPAAVDSLEAALAFASNAASSSSSSSASAMHYRDRARERREKYGQDKKLLSDLEPPSDDLKQKYLSSRAAEDAEMAMTTPLDSTNKGSKLLRSMGWSEGQGLGRNNQGIVDPIMADRRVQGAGLGAVGSKVKTAPNATYKESVKAALRDRYYELE